MRKGEGRSKDKLKIKEEREKKMENERGRMKEISEGGRKKIGGRMEREKGEYKRGRKMEV